MDRPLLAMMNALYCPFNSAAPSKLNGIPRASQATWNRNSCSAAVRSQDIMGLCVI